MRFLLMFLVFLAAACSFDASGEPSFAVSDSAGVEVVSTRLPSWEPGGSPWLLTLELEIGELEGDEPYLFGDPVSAVRLPDGRVVVADDQVADIRVFGPAGEFVQRIGRRGEGPGEFQSFSWLQRCGEELVTYDWRQRRVTSFSFTGELRHSFPFMTPETGNPPYRSRCLPDGSFLAVGWGDHPSIPAGEDFLFFKQEADLWRLFPPGDSSLTIGRYISSERLAHINRSTGGGGSGPHPFSRSVVFTGTPDRLLIGGAERLQIEVRSLSGDLLKIFRGPDAELVIDEAFVSGYEGIELTPGDSVMRRRLAAAEFPMPERYPAYTDLLVDPLGYLWVERFVLPWDSLKRWGVFSPEGVFLGHLTVPSDFDVTDVTRDHLTGIARDELGVGRVRVYRLERTDRLDGAS